MTEAAPVIPSALEAFPARRFLRLAEAAEFLELSEGHLAAFIDSGDLLAVDVSLEGKRNHWRITLFSIQGFLDSHRTDRAQLGAGACELPSVREAFPGEDFLKVEQAAAFVAASNAQIIALVRGMRLGAVDISSGGGRKYWRIPVYEFQRFLEARSSTRTAEERSAWRLVFQPPPPTDDSSCLPLDKLFPGRDRLLLSEVARLLEITEEYTDELIFAGCFESERWWKGPLSETPVSVASLQKFIDERSVRKKGQ